MKFSAAILLKVLSVIKPSLADDDDERAVVALEKKRIDIGKPTATEKTTHDDTSVSFSAQDESSKESPTFLKLKDDSSSVSSYNDMFDVGILSQIRSQSDGASTSKQRYKAHAARMRHLASIINDGGGDIAKSAKNSTLPREAKKASLRSSSSSRGQGHILATVSEEEGGDALDEEQSAKVKVIEDLLEKLKLLYCTKLGHTHWGKKFCKQDKDDDQDDDLSKTTVVSTYSYTQPAADELSDAILIRGRNLQEVNAGLSQEAVDAYEETFLGILQSNAPAGTTVTDVVITSIVKDENMNLAFTFDATSEVDCPDPCNQAEAQAESAAELEAVLIASVSSGDFATALATNLVGVTNCGTSACQDLQASAASATVAADFSGLDVCPSTKVVVCENGNATFIGGVAVTSGTTCEDACGGNCCVGERGFNDSGPCDGLSASICMDGKTCMGQDACKDANVSSIFNGCNGIQSCLDAGKYDAAFSGPSTIGRIVNSCYEYQSCLGAAREGGNITEILNSCHGEDSCVNIATNGIIGQIVNSSCIGLGACEKAAKDGTIARIESSCNGRSSCNEAAKDGYIQEIVGSCNSRSSCRDAAKSDGFIQEIVGSCNAEFACEYLAEFGGNVSLGITNSCNSYEACKGATSASSYSIYKIQDSCNSDFACAYAALYGDITSPGIIGCCNTGNATEYSEGICYLADDSTLSTTKDPTCAA